MKLAERFERVENAVGKGEIARYEQFLLFPQCFQMSRTADRAKNQGLFGKPITKRQNFKLVQIETNCRLHFKVHLK